jgi:hypothetical protein
MARDEGKDEKNQSAVAGGNGRRGALAENFPPVRLVRHV